MKFKIVLITFLISLPIWWGFNVFSDYLGNAFFDIELAKNPKLLGASINNILLDNQIKELKELNGLKNNFEELNIDAKAAISVKVDYQGNEKVVFAKNINEKLPIASLSKLMTALVVIKSYNLYQLIPITSESVAQEESFGCLVAGEKLSVNNLLHSALIESSNDAAFALTQPMSEEVFVDSMNTYSNIMGLDNTKFSNPTGLEPNNLEDIDNYSTVEDLVKLAKYILKEHSEIFEITANNSYKITRPNGTLHHFISENTNKLLKEYPEIIGGKTGWSLSAKGCLLIILDDPNSSDYYINVILGSEDRFVEMKKIIDIILEQ
jgi:D-alanyl-D-alanine carboxypeptidase